ncbi:putative cytochrome P450 monooxygenase [Aspergillus stella-maris]|uniref:putative cytochrome P450 monooxygenase n=1 Tax=Aspergillus stella-maris TaxID=1810926 RepID=UPI003CCCAF78
MPLDINESRAECALYELASTQEWAPVPTKTPLAMVACAALGFALGTVVLLHLLYNYSRLKNIPGPTLAAISGAWWSKVQRSSGYTRRLAELHQKYGAIVRLAPRIVSLSDPRHIKQLYQAQVTTEASRQHRPDEQDVSRFEQITDEAIRDQMRRIRSHKTVDLTMSLEILAAELTNQFYNGSRSSTSVTELDSQTRNEPNSSFFTTIEDFLLRGPVSTLKRDRLLCYGLAGGRAAAAPMPPDNLPSANDECLHDSHLESLNPTINASLKALRSTLLSVFHHLLAGPRVMHRLRCEINSISPFWGRSEIPVASNLIGVTYLDAVLDETLRLHILRGGGQEIRLDAEAEISACPHSRPMIIPRGTVVSWHPHVVLRDEAIFGNKTDVFRPSRWLNAYKNRQELMWESLLPLSASVEDHPKVEAAWRQVKKITVVLLREFDDVS